MSSLHPSRRVLLFACSVLFALATVTGCATLQTADRGMLASPAMTAQFGDPELRAQYAAKLLETRAGGGLPGSAPGGGCGCTQ